jgi:hypothetical protein
MGRKTSKKATIKLLRTAKDRLCTLGELDIARELGLLIDKLDPKIIDLEIEAKPTENMMPPSPPQII